MALVRIFRRWSSAAPLVGALLASVAPACSQTPTLVPVRSMERPRDVDFICLEQTDLTTWHGVPLAKCAVDENGTPISQAQAALTQTVAPGAFHLHAVVTQTSRGELAVADLGQAPGDAGAQGLIKSDPRVPGYTFLPVGAVPTDVVADPLGAAIYVASGHDFRVDVIPSEMLRAPVDTDFANAGKPGWPHLDFDRLTDGPPTQLLTATVTVGVDASGVRTTRQRLYVLLPEAKDGPKLAAFDVDASALVPVRIGDVHLSLAGAIKPPEAPVACFDPAHPNTPTSSPWWEQYATACRRPHATARALREADATLPMHLSRVAIVGETLFAADDGAPFIHVFDLTNGVGTEISRINVGTKLSSLSVSPPVPDEVTPFNADKIETCEAMDWVGDGQDHRTKSLDAKLKAKFDVTDGRCVAHRYIYGVDLINPDAGNGSIAVIDVPVVFDHATRSSAGGATTTRVARNADGSPTHETLDFASLTLQQPFGCDSPSFVATRISLGGFSLGAGNAVPARAVGFVRVDPAATGTSAPTPLRGIRCRVNGSSPIDPKKPGIPIEFPLGDVVVAPDDGTLLHAGGGGTDATAKALLDQYYDDVSGSTKGPPPPNGAMDDRRNAGQTWSSNVGVRRMRGTFATVALENGSVVILDLDDLDSTCRGPKSAASVATTNAAGTAFATSLVSATPTVSLGATATNEDLDFPVRRHHPRSTRLLTSDAVLLFSSINFATRDGTPSSQGITTNETINPHFASFPQTLASTGATTPSGDTTLLTLVAPSGDNPFSVAAETWTSTYEGALAGFTGTVGALEHLDAVSSTNPYPVPTGFPNAYVIKAPNQHFCARGVSAAQIDHPVVLPETLPSLETADFVQVLTNVQDVCNDPDPNKCPIQVSDLKRQQCIAAYGDTTDLTTPLPGCSATAGCLVHCTPATASTPRQCVTTDLARDMVILQAFDDHLIVAAPHDAQVYTADANGNVIVGADGKPTPTTIAFTDCFPGLVQYAVRARGQWVAIGSSSGFLHRKIADVATGLCVDDLSRPAVFNGRITERPSPAKDAAGNVTAPPAPSLCDGHFYVNPSLKWEIDAGSVPSQRDMALSFSVTRPTLSPLIYTAGSLPTAIRFVGEFAGDRDLLHWGQIATVDAIDRGLVIVNALDLTSSQVFN